MTDIDAEIAVKVMGWELLTVGHFGTENETPRQKELESWIDENITAVGDYWIAVDNNFYFPTELWKPSKRIDQAWQVLEKFPWPDYHVTVYTRRFAWSCDIQKMGGRLYAETEETVPLVICKCALKAVEGRKE